MLQTTESKINSLPQLSEDELLSKEACSSNHCNSCECFLKMWSFKFPFLELLKSQNWQWNGFSPVWVRKCLWNMDGPKMSILQSPNLHAYTCIPCFVTMLQYCNSCSLNAECWRELALFHAELTFVPASIHIVTDPSSGIINISSTLDCPCSLYSLELPETWKIVNIDNNFNSFK